MLNSLNTWLSIFVSFCFSTKQKNVLKISFVLKSCEFFYFLSFLCSHFPQIYFLFSSHKEKKILFRCLVFYIWLFFNIKFLKKKQTQWMRMRCLEDKNGCQVDVTLFNQDFPQQQYFTSINSHFHTCWSEFKAIHISLVISLNIFETLAVFKYF